jgi:hypothetical protein
MDGWKQGVCRGEREEDKGACNCYHLSRRLREQVEIAPFDDVSTTWGFGYAQMARQSLLKNSCISRHGTVFTLA